MEERRVIKVIGIDNDGKIVLRQRGQFTKNPLLWTTTLELYMGKHTKYSSGLALLLGSVGAKTMRPQFIGGLRQVGPSRHILAAVYTAEIGDRAFPLKSYLRAEPFSLEQITQMDELGQLTPITSRVMEMYATKFITQKRQTLPEASPDLQIAS